MTSFMSRALSSATRAPESSPKPGPRLARERSFVIFGASKDRRSMTRIRSGLAFSVAISLGLGASALAAPPGPATPPQAAAAAPAKPAPNANANANLAGIAVTNPSAFARPKETLAVSGAEIAKLAPGFELKKALVVDAAGRPVLSQ